MSRTIEDFLLLCKHTGTTMQDQLDFKRDALQVMCGLADASTADAAYHARCAERTLVILEEIELMESYIASQQRAAEAAAMLVPTAPAEAPALPAADIDPYLLRKDLKDLCKRGVVVGVHPVREKGCTNGIVYAVLPDGRELRQPYIRTQRGWQPGSDGDPLSFYRGPKCDALARVAASAKAALM